MKTVNTSGVYKTASGESFLIMQEELGKPLLSGRECLLRFYPHARAIEDVHFIQLRVTRDSEETGAIRIEKRQIQPIDFFRTSFQFEVLIRGFMLLKSGNYGFRFFCGDHQGNELARIEMPDFCFSYDMDFWTNCSFPHGLVI